MEQKSSQGFKSEIHHADRGHSKLILQKINTGVYLQKSER